MMKRLNEVFEDWLTGLDGIFYYLQNFDVPWGDDEINVELDMEYHGNVSGEKYVSPLIDKLLDSNGELDSINKMKIAGTVYAINNKRWAKLYDTMSFQYNPINNVNITEKKTGTETGLETPNNWVETETKSPIDWKTTETQTPTDWKETNTSLSADNEVNTDNSIYAFNSSAEVSTANQKVTTDSKNERTQSGSYETETEQSGSFETEKEQSGTYEDKTTYNTTVSREGFVANRDAVSVQSMIESERQIWMWEFFRIVMKDIDKSLTLQVY